MLLNAKSFLQKLMFVDILGRIQQWTSVVQNKLDLCKNDIEALRKELTAYACEIADLRKKLAECEEREKQIAIHVENPSRDASLQHTVTVDEGVNVKVEVEEADDNLKDDSKNTNQEDLEVQKVARQSEAKVLEIVCTDAAIQSIVKDKERMRREIELEAEIARLRKENERIVKERAEYENAIQRALLRGVSSLNVEALRVLRCPPIPCCTPCAPCPASIV